VPGALSVHVAGPGTLLAGVLGSNNAVELIVAGRRVPPRRGSTEESAMQNVLQLHVPPKPDPIPPGSPPGDLPVDPDTDEPDVDLPPLSPPVKEIVPPQH
jgi:hypothetical protein